MKSIKDEAIQAISSMPEDVPIDDIMYKLYVIDKIRKGQEGIAAGKGISTEELHKEMQSW
jgi:hypothetical protein